MNRYKQFLVLCLLTLQGLLALADDGVRIDPFEISANETRNIDIVLDDAAGVYVSVQFNLYLPEGIELVQQDEGGAFAYTTPHAGSAFVGVKKDADKEGRTYYQFYLEDRMLAPLGAGTIFTVAVRATDQVATGEHTGYLRAISLVDEMAGGPDIAELTYSVGTTVAVQVTELGYASFSWPRTLSFADSGAQAFIVAERGEGRVVLQEVQTVPAETGVILKADAGIYHPQTTDDDGDDVGCNLLTGTAAGPYAVAEPNSIFVLSNLSDGQAGLYVAAPGVTVAQYKAYLRLADGGEAKTGGLLFDFTPTGLAVAAAPGHTATAVYALDGRRVADATRLGKGIYVVNGRKVVVR